MLKRYGVIPLLIANLIIVNELYAQYIPDVIGSTYGAFQSRGSTGDRIAVDDDGGVHFTWMKYITYPSARSVYYNYVSVEGNWLGETAISQVNGAGFPQVVIAHGNSAGSPPSF